MVDLKEKLSWIAQRCAILGVAKTCDTPLLGILISRKINIAQIRNI